MFKSGFLPYLALGLAILIFGPVLWAKDFAFEAIVFYLFVFSGTVFFRYLKPSPSLGIVVWIALALGAFVGGLILLRSFSIAESLDFVWAITAIYWVVTFSFWCFRRADPLHWKSVWNGWAVVSFLLGVLCLFIVGMFGLDFFEARSMVGIAALMMILLGQLNLYTTGRNHCRGKELASEDDKVIAPPTVSLVFYGASLAFLFVYEHETRISGEHPEAALLFSIVFCCVLALWILVLLFKAGRRPIDPETGEVFEEFLAEETNEGAGEDQSEDELAEEESGEEPTPQESGDDCRSDEEPPAKNPAAES